MRNNIKFIFKKLPILGNLIRQRDAFLQERDDLKKIVNELKKNIKEEPYQVYPPGHFYSPIPSIKEINNYKLYIKKINKLYAIDLNTRKQLSIFNKFKNFYYELPFPKNKINKLRYFYENPNFSYGDAISLYSMIRLFKPKKIIEIGAGYSSCVILDTNEIFFKNKINCTFIEPYPELFLSLIKKNDLKKNKLIAKPLQEIAINLFKQLNKNDLLFIDSTHVSKFGSDISYIFFNILPNLKSKVIIHFHDIFYPFEYPESWLKQGLFWNEAYILRAFLQYNNSFKILLFNNYLWYKYNNQIKKDLPLFSKNPGGSIYIQKI